MAMMTMIKAIKQIHTSDVVLFKVGEFYHAYGRDAYIISYLFNYKTKTIENNCLTTGFPQGALARNIAKLEEKKINYCLVDRRNNFENEEKQDYKNLNTYDEYFSKAHEYVRVKNRIDALYNYLIDEISSLNVSDKLTQIEGIVYER